LAEALQDSAPKGQSMNELVQNTDTVLIEDMKRYVEQQSLALGLTNEARDLIIAQLDQLGTIYGRQIDRETVLRIIKTQYEMTRSGYFQDPVDIVEFVESPTYMNQKEYVRPKILEHLYTLWHDPYQYIEVILGGAIGYGKNYFLDMCLAYMLYRMSCLYSPQAHFGLAPGSNIVALLQSRTMDKAKDVVFKQFKQRLEASKYFADNFMFDKKKAASELRFPNNIVVRPVSSSDTAAISENVFISALDELNFMSVVKRSAKSSKTPGPHAETYDQAQKLYQVVHDRITSRFKTPDGGHLGKIFLLSSANYEGDFIDRKEKEALTNDRIYVVHMNQWEAAPWKFSKEMFYVKLPTRTKTAQILEEKPENMEGHIAVPVDLKTEFIRDPEESLRSKAGVAIVGQYKFIHSSDVAKARELYNKVYGKSNAIFTRETVCINYESNLKKLIDWRFVDLIKNYGPFSCHIDLGLSSDAAGVGIAHAIGGKAIEQTDNYDSTNLLPVYGIPGILAVTPPESEVEDIDIIKIRDLIFMLGKVLPIEIFTMDQFQSAAIIQAARKKGYTANLLSVDNDLAPYTDFKQSLRENRVALQPHSVLDQEYKGLDQDLIKGKVDHAEGDSKDVSDGATGAFYTVSIRRSTYYNISSKVISLADSSGAKIKEKKESASSTSFEREGRPSSGNR
jgi:hypothetical protein